jgi:hypothetical protein
MAPVAPKYETEKKFGHDFEVATERRLTVT